MGQLIMTLVAEPLKMGPVKWPISPWVIAGVLAGWVGLCLLLIFLGWRFKMPWLLWIAELLMPEDEKPRRRRRRRRGSW